MSPRADLGLIATEVNIPFPGATTMLGFDLTDKVAAPFSLPEHQTRELRIDSTRAHHHYHH